jgi:hypothetical protein
LVPYDKDGRLLADKDASEWTWLDLRVGQQVRLSANHNLHGARQDSMGLVFGKKKVFCKPGQLGADFDEDGWVTRVGQGQAHEQGVREGWKLYDINDEDTDLHTYMFDVPRDPPSTLTGTVESRNDRDCFINIRIDGHIFSIGTWWLEVAERGAVDFLPVVNVSPATAPKP